MIKTVGLDKDISIEDTVRLVLETKDGRDCLVTPYRIDSVKIYFISREFTDSTATPYHLDVEDERAKRDYEEARDAFCARKKDPVAVATTAEITLSGLQTIDGISMVGGERVLVKDQTDKSKNGIYEASESAWSRASDANEFARGSYVFVDEGIANIGSGWCLETGGVIEVGVTPLNFSRFSDNGDPSSPDQYSERRVEELRRNKLESAARSEFFYKDAEVVKVFGGNTDASTGEFFPAWLNPSMVPSEIRDKTTGDNILSSVYEGEFPVSGKFEALWDPSGLREGDYFVCWSWRPTLSSETMSAHMYFSLGGGVGLTASIPTHRTNPQKYEMLLDRYTPEMFKSYVSENDLSPLVIKGLNGSVAAGFTAIENLANQIIDLLDANATHEQLLPLLSNMFALRIKSSDPTLWRRQIKKAIPNFKRKGTIVGLKEAYGDVGMRLLRLSRLWQVVSEYYHQEHFVYDGSTTDFSLSKAMYLPTDSNFQLWFRAAEGEWQDVTSQADSLVSLYEDGVSWVGEVAEGDSFRILYNFRQVPAERQSVEDYIMSLPLMDTRDEKGQQYPPKNWNTRVVEEDDPMFGTLVPIRHPIADPIMWGWVRTEFPYSENAYNMDEYNGSKRESSDPCHIDKEFVDSCGGCQSSMFNVDLEVEGLSDASFEEARQVAEEFMPFHSIVHTFNLSGSRTEFLGPLEETIEALVTVSGSETLVAGEAQHIFNRDVDARDIDSVKRDILSSFTAVANPSGGTDWHGTMRNSKVCLYPSTTSTTSDINSSEFRGLTGGFGAKNINTSSPDDDPFESGNLLEILGSTTRAHTLASVGPSSAEIYGEVSPSSIGPLFEYRISNKVADFTVDIVQSKRVVFSDEDTDFYMLGLVTQKDVDDGVSDRDPWNIRFQDLRYKILDLLPDGTLLLEELFHAAYESGWELMDGGTVVKHASGGVKVEQNLGLVEVISPPSEGVRSTVRVGDFVYLNWGSSSSSSSNSGPYRVKSFRAGEERFYIDGYSGGDVGAETVKVYRRVVENKVGQIGYEGLVLDADDNLEALLPVSNGHSIDPDNIDSSELRENYLIFIGSEYYSILGVDGSSLTLGGRLDSYTKSGQEVDFTVYKFSKENLSLRRRFVPSVPPFDFDFVDRSGKALISSSPAEGGASLLSHALNSAKPGQAVDLAGQQESIEFEVEYRDAEEE
jgi:hypothetical protein